MNPTKTIAAFDLGTQLGWAIRAPQLQRYQSGTVSFHGTRFEGGGMRFVRFRRFLEDLRLNSGPFELVCYEEVRRHVGTDAAHIYGGLQAVLTEWCETHRIPYQAHPVQHIKKYATGKGNAKKDAVVAAVKGWGYAPADDNEADAIALLRLQLRQLGCV